MLIKHIRFSGQKDDTLGLYFIDDKWFCFCLEDEKRDAKVKGETRIPAGTYELKINRSDTPLTLKYREKYDWFKYHIQIMNVTGFDNIYIHIGNTEKHTDGCHILGDTCNSNIFKNGFIGESTNAFHRFYDKVYPVLEKGAEKVHIRIIDENFIEKL